MTKSKFEPIAIVGRGCVLPGAANPDQLKDLIKHKRVCIGAPEPGSWRVDDERVLSDAPGLYVADHIWTSAGGYVKEFSPGSHESEQISNLDSVFRWTFEAAAQALASYQSNSAFGPDKKHHTGLIMGNLSYPTVHFSQFAESIYLRQLVGEQDGAQLAASLKVDARNRFSSGLPAMLVARELGLQGGSLALDAACASGLYAIKLACDRLQYGEADTMLAGAVNAADPLFIHMGFCALSAMSKSGQSRPFYREADGLVPSEGAAFVLLKRLNDAIADGDHILGVIRGIGLSNDGRSGGFLSPSKDGQVQSVQQAYSCIDQHSSLQQPLLPQDVSLVECHATGTPVGDATEIESLKQTFGDSELVLSSLKANLGHLITTSGVAGVLKVLSAMECEELPATPNAHPLLDIIDNSAFSVLEEPQPWQGINGRLVAGVSSFGFGGNNAHLVLEKWQGRKQDAGRKDQTKVQATNKTAVSRPAAVAVIATAVHTHNSGNLQEFLDVVMSGADHQSGEFEVGFSASDMKFPPNDLKQSLGQQLLVLEVTRAALAKLAEGSLDPATTGVYVGMGTDPETCRYGLRWRLSEIVREACERDNLNSADEEWLDSVRSSLIDPLNAAAVIGKMPNIPANRLSNQYDFRGPCFTVSREELSGDAALDLAINAISRGEVETALVGAVDLSREPVHQQALAEVVGERISAADAAVMLVVKSLASAQRDGDRIIAQVERSDGEHQHAYSLDYSIVKSAGKSAGKSVDKSQPGNPVCRHVGHAHAAAGLLNLVTAIHFVNRGITIFDADVQGKIQPLLTREGKREIHVENRSFAGESSAFLVSQVDPEAGDAANNLATAAADIEIFAAPDQAGLIAAVEHRQQCDGGEVNANWPRLAIVSTKGTIEIERSKALRNLQQGRLHDGWNLGGVFYRDKALEFATGGNQNNLAFVFTGAASAYPGMGRELLLARPELVTKITPRMKNSHVAASWAYDPQAAQDGLPFYQLAGSSFLCQIHAEFSMNVLGLTPAASLGLSSGETNALFALGAWQNLDDLFDKIKSSGLYTDALASKFKSIKQFWALDDDDEVSWENWRVLAPVSQIKQIIDQQATPERVYLTIINSDHDCVIGGDSSACEKVLDQLATLARTDQWEIRSLPLGHDLAIHCPAVKPFEAIWRDLHTRPTVAPAGIRFYSNYLDGVFDVNEESVADALTGQALQTIDFPKIVNLAWHDGVRIFVEHGPRNSLISSIKDILADQAYLAVALDQQGVDSNIQAHRAAAELWCAGVKVDLHKLRQSIRTELQSTEVKSTERKRADSRKINFKMRLPQLKAIPLPDVKVADKTSKVESGVELYCPPRLHAGPATGRVMTAAPLLAGITHLVQKNRVQQKPSAVVECEQPPVPEPLLLHASTDHAAGSNSVADLLLAAHRNLKEAHQDYLDQQFKSHTAYTASMQRIQETLFGDPDGRPIETFQPLANGKPPDMGSANKRTEPQRASQAGIDKPVAQRGQTSEVVLLADPVPDLPGSESSTGLPGPKFNRQDLEILAGGKISAVLGPLFEQQDQYHIQVRMPEPPLLLCDRVLGIESEAGSMGTGTIWTETEVRQDSWYLHNNRMPGGIFIECGQADLLLISWLGIDFENRGERAYRLLGCELVFHGDLPEPGDTLQYEIHVDGHAKQGDVSLFFFHYDCFIDGEKRISVRNGQAGFFSVDELENSAGVLWSEEEATYTPDIEMPAPPVSCDKASFSHDEVVAYTEGDLVTCFGEQFDWSCTHTRTPATPPGKFNFIGEVTEFKQDGGPAGRGYLKAVSPVSVDDWFFEGHFKNDPCMPGTLMADACLQLMGFYLTATGRTLRRDGWRFQPVKHTNYKFVCRGQVLPTCRELTYELFVDEIIDADMPVLFAHVLCTVDGRKAFLCERLGLQLVPDWPVKEMPEWLDVINCEDDARPLAMIDDFPLDAKALLNCAWGQPSTAFGPGFSRFDGVGRSPRLPGPPYHYMTRISALSGEMGAMQTGSTVEVLYDIPDDAWYFEENGYPTMPNCVLMEIALQPCGWLASYTLAPDASEVELLFRNLDGTATQTREIVPTDQTMTTQVELTALSKVGDLIILKFAVQCLIDGELIADIQTAFGFFPPAAMESQKGLAISEEEKDIPNRPSEFFVDLRERKGLFFDACSACLPASKLLMLDVIDGLWPAGGQHGLGAIRGIKYVDVTEWFFKAHFFQDPVQPGSLGIEAMLQLMQAFMLQTDRHEGMRNPRFEPLRIAEEVEWHYRGQVTPAKDKITIDFEVIEEGTDAGGPYVYGEARLWVDGLKIYHAPRIGMRIVEGSPVPEGARSPMERTTNKTSVVEWSLSTTDDSWILDHRPTYTLPALPMTFEVDMMARAAAQSFPHRRLTGIRKAEAKQWMSFTEDKLSGHTEVEIISPDEATARIFVKVKGSVEPLLAAECQLVFGDRFSAHPTGTLPPLKAPKKVEDLYSSGNLFHGKSFQLVKSMLRGSNGASAVLNARSTGGKAGNKEVPGVPTGLLNPALLDAALHLIPHDDYALWCKEADSSLAAYPVRIENLELFAEIPSEGEVHVEARFLGLESKLFPRTRLLLMRSSRQSQVVFASFELVEILLPKGPLGTADPIDRRAFLRDRQYVPTVTLSSLNENTATLYKKAVTATDWLPGTIARIYHHMDEHPRADLTRRVCIAEQIARHTRIHPYFSSYDEIEECCVNLPLNRLSLQVHEQADKVSVTSMPPAEIDWQGARDTWIARTGGQHKFIHDLCAGLIRNHVRRFVIADTDAFARMEDQPAIYLANHQTGVESFLFLSLVSATCRINAVAMAKKEHLDSWIGDIYRLSETSLSGKSGLGMLFFDRENQADMLESLQQYAAESLSKRASLLVHAEGTRSHRGGATVGRLSSVMIDLATNNDLPIIPVKLVGGLPLKRIEDKLEFPYQMGRQDYILGEPVQCQTLLDLPYVERSQYILSMLNNLGPTGNADVPLQPNQELVQMVAEVQMRGITEAQAVMRVAIETLPGCCEETELVAQAISTGNSKCLDALQRDEKGLIERLLGLE